MTAEWNAGVGRLITALGTSQFPVELVAALKAIVDFDYSVMFAYCGDARPIDLYDDFPASKRRVMVHAYQDGPYLLDPLFLACSRQVEPDLYRLKDLAPDRFYQGEYFRSYYVQTGLSEEIGFIAVLPGWVMAVISLMRSNNNPVFSAREFSQLRQVHPVVSAAAARHWHDLHRSFAKAEEPRPSIIQRNIDYAFRNFGKSVLTPRERDVVEYVLKGHSSEAIGKILGISAGTVRIHRKNIYIKLGINSQGELFSQFIEALTSGAGA
jgi:DNA-binding CsgD family transcriptional regulator